MDKLRYRSQLRNEKATYAWRRQNKYSRQTIDVKICFTSTFIFVESIFFHIGGFARRLVLNMGQKQLRKNRLHHVEQGLRSTTNMLYGTQLTPASHIISKNRVEFLRLNGSPYQSVKTNSSATDPQQ